MAVRGTDSRDSDDSSLYSGVPTGGRGHRLDNADCSERVWIFSRRPAQERGGGGALPSPFLRGGAGGGAVAGPPPPLDRGEDGADHLVDAQHRFRVENLCSIAFASRTEAPVRPPLRGLPRTARHSPTLRRSRLTSTTSSSRWHSAQHRRRSAGVMARRIAFARRRRTGSSSSRIGSSSRPHPRPLPVRTGRGEWGRRAPFRAPLSRAAAGRARVAASSRRPQRTSTFLNCQGSLGSMSSGKKPGRSVSGVQSV